MTPNRYFEHKICVFSAKYNKADRIAIAREANKP